MEWYSISKRMLYSTTLVGIIASTLPNCNCGSSSKKCESPAYETMQQGLSLEQQEQYLAQTCPSGCNYDQKVGCCWCPE